MPTHPDMGALSLVPLVRAHIAQLMPLLDAPCVREGLGREQSAHALLEKELTGSARGTRMPFAVGFGGELVGLCGLSSHGLPRFRLDVYYWLGVPYWGCGLATYAVSTLVARAFEEEDVTELTSLVRARNARSRRVLERNGFTERRRSRGAQLGRADLADETVLELYRPLRMR